jgi:hypothetical protein
MSVLEAKRKEQPSPCQLVNQPYPRQLLHGVHSVKYPRIFFTLAPGRFFED